MLNIHFTLAYVVSVLTGIAYREPNRVGQEGDGVCIYGVVKNHALVPVCIVGQWFSDEGLLRLLVNTPNSVALTLNDHHPGNEGACALGGEFWDNIEKYGVTADEDAKKFAHCVQSQQDNGDTWEEALNRGIEDFKRWKVAQAEDVRDSAKAQADNAFVTAQQEVEALFAQPEPLADWERELLGDEPQTNGW